MKHIFSGKRISAIVSVLPQKIVRYEDELDNYPFPVAQSKRLGMMMDYVTRRQSEPDEGLSDYALYGIKYLLDKGVISLQDIEAIVVVTSSQDYIMPSVSYILQGKLGLNRDVYCCDIAQVCGGYVYGLMQSFMLIDTFGFKKVLLVTGDLLTKKTGIHDRNSRPILGDAANVSVIEQYNEGKNIYCSFANYGNKADAIRIEAGGLKMPSTPVTAIETKDASGNLRALDHFYMDGEGVFNFVMTQVPPMIETLLRDADCSKEQVDYYMFHQPNRYMVSRLAGEMDIPEQKCPANIVGIYGNASTATVPLNICHNIAAEATTYNLTLCLSGFGGGLTCNAMLLQNPPMTCCEIIDYQKE